MEVVLEVWNRKLFSRENYPYLQPRKNLDAAVELLQPLRALAGVDGGETLAEQHLGTAVTPRRDCWHQGG